VKVTLIIVLMLAMRKEEEGLEEAQGPTTK
jgi:hypothetical protein